MAEQDYKILPLSHSKPASLSRELGEQGLYLLRSPSHSPYIPIPEDRDSPVSYSREIEKPKTKKKTERARDRTVNLLIRTVTYVSKFRGFE